MQWACPPGGSKTHCGGKSGADGDRWTPDAYWPASLANAMIIRRGWDPVSKYKGRGMGKWVHGRGVCFASSTPELWRRWKKRADSTECPLTSTGMHRLRLTFKSHTGLMHSGTKNKREDQQRNSAAWCQPLAPSCMCIWVTHANIYTNKNIHHTAHTWTRGKTICFQGIISWGMVQR